MSAFFLDWGGGSVTQAAASYFLATRNKDTGGERGRWSEQDVGASALTHFSSARSSP